MSPPDINRILDRLDSIHGRCAQHGEALAAIVARLDYLATRDDLSTAISTHVDTHHRRSVSWRPIVAGIGALLAAVAAAIGAIAAQ